MDILAKIIDSKRRRIEYSKSIVSIQELKSRLNEMDSTRDFKGAITRGLSLFTDEAKSVRLDSERSRRMGTVPVQPIRLIAEIKKASPSKGLIKEDFNLKYIASVYEEKSVNAVSVLTEEDFFQGSLQYIRDVKSIVTKPVLRKDFIVDEYQLYETRANSADAVLLIAAALGKNQAEEYVHLCRELGLHVLFEVHDEDELEKALMIKADIIGINNRNLKTLKIDLATTLRLIKDIPGDKIVVSESGIREKADVVKLEAAGLDAMLIGTSLMQSKNIGAKIAELMREFQTDKNS